MRNCKEENKYEEKLKYFNLNLNDLPRYDNPENFANKFKKCSIYEYGNISYTNSSIPQNNLNSNK